MKKLLLLLIPLFLFTSCESTYELIREKSNAILMERDKCILVTTAKNGFYENTEYKNSGQQTTNNLVSKLRPYADTIDITNVSSFKKIEADKLLNYDYVIVPEIYHWEDRATNLSFLPDKMILGLTVYDNTGTILNNIEIRGESTKTTMANNDPIELVNEALDIYIRRLFEL